MNFGFGSTSARKSVALDQERVIECLRHFIPFDDMRDEELLLLSAHSRVEDIDSGSRLFDVGDEDTTIYCLLRGSVRLEASDGRSHVLSAGTEQCKRPVAQLRPRMYSAVTTAPSRCISIEAEPFGDVIAGAENRSYVVSEIRDDYSSEMVSEHYQRLLDGEFELPSLPDVAIKACQALNDDNATHATIAKVIGGDVAMAAKLVRAANSAIYYGKASVDSCERALFRLGKEATKQLVLSYSISGLFEAKTPLLNELMHAMWRHSVEVAAMSRVVSGRLQCFDEEQAQLAGLVHDIGSVAIISYAQSQPSLCDDSGSITKLIEMLCADLGVQILREWNFSESMVVAAGEAENWWRNEVEQPELADLVCVSQLLSFVGKSAPPDVPNFSKLPAYQKLVDDRFTPEDVLNIIAEADEELTEVRVLLGN